MILHLEIISSEAGPGLPHGLQPASLLAVGGTAEAVPLQNRFARHRLDLTSILSVRSWFVLNTNGLHFCLDIHRLNPADYGLVGFESSPALALAKPEWLPH